MREDVVGRRRRRRSARPRARAAPRSPGRLASIALRPAPRLAGVRGRARDVDVEPEDADLRDGDRGAGYGSVTTAASARRGRRAGTAARRCRVHSSSTTDCSCTGAARRQPEPPQPAHGADHRDQAGLHVAGAAPVEPVAVARGSNGGRAPQRARLAGGRRRRGRSAPASGPPRRRRPGRRRRCACPRRPTRTARHAGWARSASASIGTSTARARARANAARHHAWPGSSLPSSVGASTSSASSSSHRVALRRDRGQDRRRRPGRRSRPSAGTVRQRVRPSPSSPPARGRSRVTSASSRDHPRRARARPDRLRSAEPSSARHHRHRSRWTGCRLPARVARRRGRGGHADGFSRASGPASTSARPRPAASPARSRATRADYDRWLGEMGRLGVRVVRVYTILPPAFYDALRAYDRAHPARADLPDPGGLDPGGASSSPTGDAYAPAVTTASRPRSPTPSPSSTATRPAASGRGHAGGQLPRRRLAAGCWPGRSGVEWDPLRDALRPTASTPACRPTTAATSRAPSRRDADGELARVDARLHGRRSRPTRGWSRPLTFTNWLTTDPLHHP